LIPDGLIEEEEPEAGNLELRERINGIIGCEVSREG
jgi:hypothetical protein